MSVYYYLPTSYVKFISGGGGINSVDLSPEDQFQIALRTYNKDDYISLGKSFYQLLGAQIHLLTKKNRPENDKTNDKYSGRHI